MATDPSLPDANYMMGKIHALKGNFQDAEQNFRRAIESHHAFEYAYRDLFYGLMANNLRDDATEVIKEAIANCPMNAEFHFCFGNLNSEAGELQDAIACYRATLELTPTSVPALISIGNILLTLGQSNDAETFFRKALALDDTSLQSRLGLGKTFDAMGNTNAAIKYYTHATDHSPDSPLPWLELGSLHLSQGELMLPQYVSNKQLNVTQTRPLLGKISVTCISVGTI